MLPYFSIRVLICCLTSSPTYRTFGGAIYLSRSTTSIISVGGLGAISTRWLPWLVVLSLAIPSTKASFSAPCKRIFHPQGLHLTLHSGLRPTRLLHTRLLYTRLLRTGLRLTRLRSKPLRTGDLIPRRRLHRRRRRIKEIY